MNGGGTWNLETVTPATTDELYGAVALSSTAAWAVGANGLILHYSGGSWTSQRLAGWSGKALRGIAFSGLTGWAVGDGLGIARTTDGGLTWSTFQSPAGSAVLRSVAGLGVSQTAIAVGDSGKIEYIDFTSAHPQSAPAVNLYGVTFVDDRREAEGDSATILRASNGGLTWSSPVAGVPLMPGLMPSQSASGRSRSPTRTTGSAVGYQYQGVWRTCDGGASWVVEQLVTARPDSGNYPALRASFADGSASAPVVVGRSSGDDILTNQDQTARAYLGT